MPVHVELVDHTADVGIKVIADSAAGAFAATAGAMFDIMLDRTQVEEGQRWNVRIDASGFDDLLVTWLEDLLYAYEMERLVPKSIYLKDIDSRHLTAELRGEILDQARHEPGVQIKAVTYHRLRVEETTQGFVIQVIFDI